MAAVVIREPQSLCGARLTNHAARTPTTRLASRRRAPAATLQARLWRWHRTRGPPPAAGSPFRFGSPTQLWTAWEKGPACCPKRLMPHYPALVLTRNSRVESLECLLGENATWLGVRLTLPHHAPYRVVTGCGATRPVEARPASRAEPVSVPVTVELETFSRRSKVQALLRSFVHAPCFRPKLGRGPRVALRVEATPFSSRVQYFRLSSLESIHFPPKRSCILLTFRIIGRSRAALTAVNPK